MKLGVTAVGTSTLVRVDMPLVSAVTEGLLNGDALIVVTGEVSSQFRVAL